MKWQSTGPGRYELTETSRGKNAQAFALELGPIFLITANFDPNDLDGELLVAPIGSVVFRNDLVRSGHKPGDGGLMGPTIYTLLNDLRWYS